MRMSVNKTEAEIYKIKTFQKFICLKYAFKAISHKKIAHFILERYSNIKHTLIIKS